MKMVKVDDDIHARLKESDKSINKTLRDLVFGRTDPLESLSGQVKMMFDLLVDMDSRMGSPLVISEGSGESSQDRFLRMRREDEDRRVVQKNAVEHPAVEHPEDIDQSGGW